MTVGEKIEQFRQELIKLFPGLDTTHLKYGNTEGNKEVWNFVHFNIPPENKNLKRSPYFYNEATVVHFTDIFALNSIIQEQAIRLYQN